MELVEVRPFTRTFTRATVGFNKDLMIGLLYNIMYHYFHTYYYLSYSSEREHARTQYTAIVGDGANSRWRNQRFQRHSNDAGVTAYLYQVRLSGIV